MVKYSLGGFEKTTGSVNRKSVFFMVELDIPEAVRETISHQLVTSTIGHRIMGFYCDPLIGDCLEFNGFLYKIIGRYHQPVERYKRGQRFVPILQTKYLKRLEEPESD